MGGRDSVPLTLLWEPPGQMLSKRMLGWNERTGPREEAGIVFLRRGQETGANTNVKYFFFSFISALLR